MLYTKAPKFTRHGHRDTVGFGCNSAEGLLLLDMIIGTVGQGPESRALGQRQVVQGRQLERFRQHQLPGCRLS